MGKHNIWVVHFGSSKGLTLEFNTRWSKQESGKANCRARWLSKSKVLRVQKCAHQIISSHGSFYRYILFSNEYWKLRVTWHYSRLWKTLQGNWWRLNVDALKCKTNNKDASFCIIFRDITILKWLLEKHVVLHLPRLHGCLFSSPFIEPK